MKIKGIENMKVKTINFNKIKDNNFILSPKHYLKGGDGSRDLSKCAKCKKLFEDRHLYSEVESGKEFCVDCFNVINENKSKSSLLSELKRIRDISEQDIYYKGKIKKYSPSEKVKLLEKCLKDVGISIWELEKALKIKK